MQRHYPLPTTHYPLTYMPHDNRQYAAATERNRESILTVLQRVLPSMGTVLEIASGTGQHAVFFAPRLAPRYWLPSDPQPVLRESIIAWSAAEPADNLLPPIILDATASRWPIEDLPKSAGVPEHPPISSLVNINMIHISPWEACLGLLAGAQRILPSGGILYLYGPYQREGQHTAPSNASFDGWLRSQNPTWGVRHLEDVITAAQSHQLHLQSVVKMPANNLSVIFEFHGP
ncbi:MAG: DUF938 domain-containing protein [Cyanobacteria bacterium J06635_1]